jgi:integrase
MHNHPNEKAARRTKIVGKGCENIYESRSGRYEIAYRSAGKLQWHSMPLGSTLAETKAKRAELTVAKNEGTLALPTKETVAQAATRWLEENGSQWSGSTNSSREAIVRLHIVSVIGHIRLRDLTSDHVWKVVLSMREKSLERSSQRLTVTVFGTLCSWLVDEKKLAANPVLALSKQRRKQLASGEQEKVKVISDPGALLREVRQPYTLIVKTSLLTGLRLAEVLGLRVRDVGETHLHVNGQLDRPTRLHTDRVKTPAARRDVVLPTSLRLELLAGLPEDAGPDDLVFRAKDGKGHWSQLVERAFKMAAKRAKLDPSLTFHTTRHTAASRLIAAGSPVTYVQHQLGHQSPQVTLGTYAHLFGAVEHEAEARETLDAAFAEMSRPALKVVA